MSDNPWFEILARISSHQPVDLDKVLAPKGTKNAVSIDDDLKLDTDAQQNVPSPMLWHDGSAENAYIGVRVTKPVNNTYALAVKLAAAAAERNVIPIILATFADCGFERFGFRVERLAGSREIQQIMQAQLCSFWDMAIVIDIDQVSALG